MRVVVVGAGPVGSFSALMLARRGHEVVLVDRDPGPVDGGSWARRGMMQFNLPHFFRPQVRQSICAETPELWSALLLAGGLPARPEGFPEEMTGLQSRRATFERAVWTFLDAEPGVSRLCGHADRLLLGGGRVTGVVVDGAAVTADLVVVASGRAGRVGDDIRPAAESASCGFSYAARQYRALPGVDLPDWGMPRYRIYDGYLTIVFPQDAQTLSALIVRPTADAGLLELRHNGVFEAAAAAIPFLAEWTDPARFEPITDVLSGSNLVNAYRRQARAGDRYVDGVVFVGDAVLTTNPAAGRGVALGLQQARMLVSLLDGSDIPTAVAAFEAWCDTNMRPWYEDHVYWDETLLRRFMGYGLDLDARIPSDVVVECAQVDPSIFAAAGPYLAMLALPSVLDGVQDKARAVLRTGWRPSYADGPTRDDLVDLMMQPVA
ncbi:MAG TPA: FAD-dependent oxidoreductase [Mycobacteriales bacterium]|nr:FAD-dependent oxidoreductase [Mycobacteriales bacterium]